MTSPLANLLFNDYRRRVLGLLLLRPDQAYHVREIARLTGTVPGTLHKELSRLAEVGLLAKQLQGNQVSYRANRECVIFEELAAIMRKTSGVADVLAEALAPVAKQIEVALVFGSMASGKATEGSDIDLLVIGEVEFAELVKALHPTQELLGREINPKLYSRAEWRQVKQENSSFIRELLERPLINVIGGKDDLG
jgi:predicted nucleotidyltransferase